MARKQGAKDRSGNDVSRVLAGRGTAFPILAVSKLNADAVRRWVNASSQDRVRSFQA